MASVKILTLAAVVSFAAPFTIFADHNPPTCTLSAANVALGPFCNSNATGSLLGQPVVAGQTIYYQAALSHNSDLLCGFEGGQIFITTPNGVTTDATPAGGVPLVCGSPSCSPAGVPIVFSKIVSYVVRAQDINVNSPFFQPCATNSVQATVRYTGGHSHCDAADQCDPSAATSVCNPSRVIGFVVEKAVACTTGQVCDASLTYSASATGISTNGNGTRFCFRFIYRNTNSAGLLVTNVFDSLLGQLVGPTNNFALAPGAVVTNFPGMQAFSNTTVNTVVAQASQTAQSCFLTTVVTQASATATVMPASVAVSKVCDGAPFGFGQPIRFRGTVTNTGSATLTGITVTDNQAGTLLTGITLPPGASTNYNGSYTPTGNPCGPFTDTVTVIGTASGVCPVNISNSATTTCSVITAPAISVTKVCDGAPFTIGQPIRFRGTVSNSGNVTLTNVTVVDNQAGSVLSGVTLAPGASTNYTGSYTPAGNGCGPFTNTVTATGVDQCTGGTVSNQATVVCTVATAPCIAVTKVCDGAPFTIGQPIRFRGTVSNCGNVTLTGVTVTDNRAGSVLSGVTLAPGASTNYSGSYTPAGNGCGPFTNTVTATGADQCTGGTVSNQATVVCTVATAPCIAVTKVCDGAPFTIGQPIRFRGTVSNCGNVTLTGVTVTDNRAGSVLSGVTLAPGASTNYTGSYTPAGNGCGPFTNTVTATGADQCTGGTVSNQATVVCTVATAPCIAVTKVCDGAPFTIGQPIRFRGTVSNCGNVTLTGVTVTDNQAGSVLSGVTLAPGASTNYTGSYTPAGNGCGPFTNTVTATGVDQCTGGTVSNQATVVCTVATAPCIAVTKVCDGAPFTIGQPIRFRGTVSNCGNVTLTGVTVTDNQAGSVLSGVTLAPGASTNYTGSYTPAGSGCGPFTNTVTATGVDQCTGGTVSNQATVVCTVATAPCIAVTKVCDGAPFIIGQPIRFRGTVSNCGNVTLTGVTVTDNQAGSVLSGVTLAPGASTNYTGSYTPAGNGCGPFTNTVTATGVDQCTGGTVSNQATVVCTVATAPCIAVTKVCDGAPFTIGQPIRFRGTVSNCGNVTLTGVTVTDNRAGSVLSGVTLAPGASTNYTGSYTPAGSGCGPFTNTVTATGVDQCTGGTVSNQATVVCTVATAPCIAVTKVCDGAPFIIGQPIRFRGTVSNCGNVTLTGVTVTDNQAGSVLSGVTLAPGASTNYTGSYTPAGNGCGPFTNTVTATGVDQCTGGTVSNQATVVCTVATAPCIAVTKVCDGAPFIIGQPIRFRGTVSNCGNVTLTGVTVTDNQAGSVLGGVTLAPGASTNYTGSYTPAGSGCGPFTNTVTATGVDQCTGGTVSNQATVVCTVATAPCIAVTKVCDGAPFIIGQPIRFRGTVSNCGNVTLTGVTVTDNQAGSVLSGVTLAPGASTNYTGSYTPAGNGCGPFTNTVTATGVDQCTGGTVSNQATVVCTVATAPCIAVTKVCDGAPFIIGQPIRFRGTVSNCGNVTLTGVTVTDNQAGSVLGGVTLAPGASTNYTGSYTPAGSGCGPFTNTVTATGVDQCTGGTVSNQATVVCTVATAPCIAVTKVCDGAPFIIGQPIRFRGTVSNCGNVTLTGVTVTDNQAGSVLSGVTLAPGASTNYTGSYTPAGNGCGPFTNTVTATGVDQCTGGTVSNQATVVCTVATAPCIAVTKVCDGAPFTIGQPIRFRGTVSNCGNVTLTGVTVTDNQAGSVLGGVTLAPGASTNYTGSYTPAGAGCGPFTNTVTATGVDQCTGGTVSNQATVVCTVATAPCIAVTKVCDGAPFTIGQPIRFRGTVSNCGNVTLTGVTVTDNQAGSVLSGVTLAPGASTNYTGSYTPAGAGCGPFTNTVTATGVDQCTGGTVSNQATVVCTVATAPCIAVTKVCDGAPFTIGQPIRFRGTVSNCGNVTLTGVTVTDDEAGTVLTAVTLASGSSSDYSGSYMPTNNFCGPLTDTVTASGFDQCTGSNVFSQASVSCTVTTTPAISVTKVCDGGPFLIGQPIRFRGTVCNTGNVILTSVRVRDDQAGIVLIGVTLAPGDCTNYSGSFIAAACPEITNSVTAIGFDLCSNTPVSSEATAVCEVACPPRICVTKQVACVVSNDTCGTFGGSATGVMSINPPGVTNLPAFCYAITVSNCGSQDLQNVSVTDTVYGVLATNISLLPIDASTNFTFMTELSGDTTNIVTAMGTGAITLADVSASASATAFVERASIACTKFADPLSLTCGSGPQPVTYSVSVFNTGDADLTNVTINDVFLTTNGCILPAPFSLRANALTNLTLCTIPVDCSVPGTANNCSSPLLGQAAGCTVLQLGGGFQVSMTGPPGGIQGDVCIGPRSKLSMSGSQFITGCVRLAPGATFSRSGSTTIGCLQMNQDISGEISAAIAASQNAAALPCTRHLSNFTSGTTITGDAGQNVLCLDKVVLGGGVVTLTGPPGASFVINVTGKFALSGGAQIRVAGGLQPRDVLYNIIGTGEQVAFSGGGGGMDCCKAVVDGTLIALDRNIALSPGLVNGQLVGGRNISIVSGASVRCPPSPPECAPVVNTLTVVGEVAEVQSNLLACVRDRHGNPISVGSECSVSVACGTTNPPPPTCPVTTISANFNGTAIPAGAFIWFNQIVSVSGRDTNPANVHFSDASISFTANGVLYNLTMPESLIVFSASATQATTTFDTANNRWVTTVPVGYSGNVFVGGVPFQVPAGGFAGGISPVTWSGIFSSDVAGLGFSWKWAAAVYSQFSSNNNVLGVKPIDGSQLNPYSNADHAGTPENYKNFVTGGARGGGGSNFTGSYSGTANVTCPQ